MRTGLIRRFERELTISRADERLSMAWVGQNQTNELPKGLAWIHNGHPEQPRPGLHLPVLGMVKSAEDPAFVHLAMLAHAGARVYLLVPENWGKQPNLDPEFVRAPTVLMRRISDVPASVIITASETRVWLGGPWSLRLDEKQADALRQTFLHLFWHEAFEEAWTGEKQLVWRVARERPFDVPAVEPRAHVRVGADIRLQMDLRGAFVFLQSNDIPAVAPKKLWFRAGAEHHDKLARLVRQGTNVVWSELHLQDLAVRDGAGEVVVGGKKSRMRIVLNGQQAADAQRLLESPAPWSFGVDIRIGEPHLRSATFWLSGETSPRGLEERQTLSVGDVLANGLRAVPETSPEKRPPAQPLALAVQYTWSVIPPKAPAGSTEDSLVKQWRDVDADWSERLRRLQENAARFQDNRSRVEKRFQGLLSVLLGFGRTYGALVERVTELMSQRPSAAGPSDAADLLSRLTALEEEMRGLQKNVDDAECRAMEDEERAKQKSEWQNRVKTAQEQLDGKREALAVQDERVVELAAERDDTEKELEEAKRDTQKDAYARKKKLDDELAKAKKNAERLRQEVRALEDAAKEEFQFRPASKAPTIAPTSGGRFVPTANTKSMLSLPDEALPEVGELRVFQKQRYLVIRMWEQLDAGERAAARLQAKLVAAEDV